MAPLSAKFGRDLGHVPWLVKEEEEEEECRRSRGKQCMPPPARGRCRLASKEEGGGRRPSCALQYDRAMRRCGRGTGPTITK
eukprot:410966-Prymnesium_polylepis.1